MGSRTSTRVFPSLQKPGSTGKWKPQFLRGAGSWFVMLDTHQSSPARIHPLRLTSQHKHPPSETPKSVVNAALQLYLFNLLALFPWKNIFTHRKYFPQVFSALLLQPPEAMSVVQSPQGDEAKVAGGTWLPLRVTYQLHLATRVKARGTWTGQNSVTSSAGFSPSLSAARRSCSIRSTTGSKCWQH